MKNSHPSSGFVIEDKMQNVASGSDAYNENSTKECYG